MSHDIRIYTLLPHLAFADLSAEVSLGKFLPLSNTYNTNSALGMEIYLDSDV